MTNIFNLILKFKTGQKLDKNDISLLMDFLVKKIQPRYRNQINQDTVANIISLLSNTRPQSLMTVDVDTIHDVVDRLGFNYTKDEVSSAITFILDNSLLLGFDLTNYFIKGD